jgi:hypothetical protein
MILLRELLDEYWHGDKPSSEKEERSVWQTYSKKFAGRNSMGQVRYFKDREDAAKFATGAVAAPHVGRPKPKKRAKRKERIQKYDVKPVTPYDPEKIH